MIYDSSPWKKELLRAANKLERSQRTKKWTERIAFIIEREVMLGAFAIRRLNEARKISDRMARQSVPVRRHELTSNPPDIWDAVEPWKQFDLTTSTSEELTLSKFCNQIIHSWSWLVSGEETGMFDGIYVTSDRDRTRYLYFIHVETLIGTFRRTGKDDIVEMKMKRNKKGERIFYDLLSAEDIKLRDHGPI